MRTMTRTTSNKRRGRARHVVRRPQRDVASNGRRTYDRGQGLATTSFIKGQAYKGHKGRKSGRRRRTRNKGNNYKVFGTLASVVLRGVRLMIRSRMMTRRRRKAADRYRPRIADTLNQQARTRSSTLRVSLFLERILTKLFLQPRSRNGRAKGHRNRADSGRTQRLRNSRLHAGGLTRYKARGHAYKSRYERNTTRVFQGAIKRKYSSQHSRRIRASRKGTMTSASTRAIQRGTSRRRQSADSGTTQYSPQHATTRSQTHAIERITSRRIKGRQNRYHNQVGRAGSNIFTIKHSVNRALQGRRYDGSLRYRRPHR